MDDKKIIKLQWRIGKMRILICDDEQKLIDLELSILQEYCRSTNIAATFFTFTKTRLPLLFLLQTSFNTPLKAMK